MLSANQCIRKSQEVEAMASFCLNETTKARFFAVAGRWRSMATMAAQHDSLEASLLSSNGF